jgi:hypothetical protein
MHHEAEHDVQNPSSGKEELVENVEDYGGGAEVEILGKLAKVC